jgi:LysM repeat protein
MRRILLTTLLSLLLITLQVPGTVGHAWQDPGNLLGNPGFEGDYYPWFNMNEVQVAHGWTPWWRSRTDADPPATYFKPEFKQANGYIYPNRVHGGAAAQQWFTFHATHLAGMYQQVSNVTPGASYRFSAWAQVWSSTEDNGDVSQNPAYPNLRVGIDPTGNWDAFAGTVVWSGTYAFFDSWGQLAVEAKAQNNVITVFLRAEPNFPVKHNDIYWDDAQLVLVGQGEPPPPPTATQPGSAPATATSAAAPQPTATCAPAPADWVTYYVQRGDTLFSLSKRTGTTVERVMSVNCLTSTTIHVGQPLLLPKQPATFTPQPATATPAAVITTSTAPPATATSVSATTTATPIPATATTAPSATSTSTPTAAPTATRTRTPIPPSATPVPATATPVPTAPPSATSTRAQPTIPPPATSTPGAPAAPPTSTPSGSSTRPCGTIAVGAGIVLVAGAFRFRRRDRDRV